MWQTRDDSVPGKIYLMRAIGYGGLIPGCLIGRYKIGLSINPDARLEQLLSSQPCTDITLIHTVDVADMVEVESELHQIFKNSNVKLAKSREWFSLNPFQVQKCIWIMNRAKMKATGNGISFIPTRGFLANSLIVAGLGLLLFTALQPHPQPNELKIKPSQLVETKK